MRPHHYHNYQPPRREDDWGPEGMSTLICYDEDCSKGIDFRTYPLEMLGPKLVPLDRRQD